MAEGRDRSRRGRGPIIPLEPVDLLAGLAPGVELFADDVPEDIEEATGDDAVVTVAEVGKMVRSGDDTVRRLIRTPGFGQRDTPADPGAEVERAGVVPRTRTRPGE